MIIDIFELKNTEGILKRIEKLTPESTPIWGKMNIGQMLAHCNVTYTLVFENTYPKPGKLKRFLLQKLIKPSVVSDKPYKINLRTAPEFLITDLKEFNKEKEILITNIKKAQSLGAEFFIKHDYHAFGFLNKEEWSNLFYKHLDHHLKQFGA